MYQPKNLKIILTDIMLESKNIAQKRSKSLVEVRSATLRTMPQNKQFINTEVTTNNRVNDIFETRRLFIKLSPLKDGNIKDSHNMKKASLEKNSKADLYIKLNKVALKSDLHVEHSLNLNEDSKPKSHLNGKTKASLGKAITNPMNNSKLPNLRRLQPKNYTENSLSENPLEGAELQTKTKFPIYKKTLSDSEKSTKPIKDVYEFIDFSPTENRPKKRRQHNSSMLFDKETHEILKKIEEKEAKAKKKVVRERKKLKKRKAYDRVVNKIISEVMKKISNRIINIPTTKSGEPLQNKGDNQSSKHGTEKLIQISNFQEDMNIIVHNPANNQALDIKKHVNSSQETTKVRDPTIIAKLMPGANIEIPSNNNNVSFLNTTSDIDPVLLHSDESCDNSVAQKDIDSCFGFDVPVPVASTPAKSTSVNIINNVVLKCGVANIDSPNDFNGKLPNANSTMLQTRIPERKSSPWRGNWINVRRNPHFVSVKDNALPRVDQEMVLDHTLVEDFESNCSKISSKQPETPAKKPAVQKSMLDFISSNIEQEKEVLQMSLYDYEAFNSPEKSFMKTPVKAVQRVKRNILGNVSDIVASSPTQRRPLADISNSSREQNTGNATYFGFDESPEISPRNRSKKRKRINNLNSSEDNDENDAAKPYRFNPDRLKSYSKKDKQTKKHVAIVEPLLTSEEQNSISIAETSNEENVDEIHLFEEPEEMLDNMSPVHINEKKSRRKRLNSCDSETSDCEKKKKKRKKTKLEIEQETWVEDFNKLCEEIEQHELELE